MKIIFLLLCLVEAVKAATTELGTIAMLLLSDSDADPTELNEAMLQTTTKYLDDYFNAYYANTQPENYFSHAGLVVDSYGVFGVGGGGGGDDAGQFMTTVELEGLLFFNHDPVPSATFLRTLLKNAFSNRNQLLYLKTLLNHKESMFLQQLISIVIEIDGEVTAEIMDVAEYLEDVAMEDDDPDNENVEEESKDSLKTKEQGDEDETEMWYEGEWVDYAIMVGAGVGGALAVIMMYVFCKCFCRRCYGKNKYDGYDADDEDDFPVKPVGGRDDDSITTIQQREMRASRRSQQDDDINVAKTYSADRSASPSPPPSPMKSITSIDSSKFTYQLAGGVSKMNVKKNDESLVHVDIDGDSMMSNMDMSLFTKQTNISVSDNPFGQDISAIDNDENVNEANISLVEEGVDRSLIVKHHKPASSRQLNALEKRAASSRATAGSKPRNTHHRAYSQPSINQTTRQSKKRSMLGYRPDDSIDESDYTDSSRDVINDLRDLSLQIDLHRRKSAI